MTFLPRRKKEIRRIRRARRTKKPRIATSSLMKTDIKKMLNNRQKGGETRPFCLFAQKNDTKTGISLVI